MTISSGHLDSLLDMTFQVQTLANLTYLSGSASNGAVNSVTAKTAATTYPTFDSLKVTSIDDSNNTIVVTGYYTSSGGYYGGGTTTAVPWYFTVVGQSGNDLLLAANGSAALTSVPASTVAAYIQGGNSATLSNDLFAFAIDGTNISTEAAPSQTLTFSSFTAAAAETVAMVTASTPASAVAVADSAANVQAGLDALQTLSAGGKISGITLTDSGTPQLSVTAAQLTGDSGALGQISGSYSLTVTNVPIVQASTVANTAHVGMTVVSDSSANVFAALDGLQSLITNGHSLSIGLTDSGAVNLTVSAAQLAADAAVLKDITSNYTLTVPAGTAAATITGIDGHATTVQFTGNASQYTVSSANGVISVSAGGVTDQISHVSALKFADLTEIVAATPGPANAVTTGNITELYSAVLAREPDVGGLAFYQNFLAKNPGTPLQTFATFFLNSSEYTGAHNYPETAAGDQQFIADSYQNLLHRTPSASEVSFYENNVLAPAVANQTAGSAGYAAAQQQAHALMLVYFSASSEFLSDVQITAANPASASHWLLLA